MPSAQPIRKDAKTPRREPFRTLRGWANGSVTPPIALCACFLEPPHLTGPPHFGGVTEVRELSWPHRAACKLRRGESR
jgi:hypothetical protein